MAIERWDPFREAISLRDAMNSLLQESFVVNDLSVTLGVSLFLPFQN